MGTRLGDGLLRSEGDVSSLGSHSTDIPTCITHCYNYRNLNLAPGFSNCPSKLRLRWCWWNHRAARCCGGRRRRPLGGRFDQAPRESKESKSRAQLCERFACRRPPEAGRCSGNMFTEKLASIRHADALLASKLKVLLKCNWSTTLLLSNVPRMSCR